MATHGDRAILNSIFNPLLPLGEEICDDDEAPNDLREADDGNDDLTKEAKRIESEGVVQAEKGNLDESITLFNRSIDLAPLRPSGYNNRAQALRLKGDVDGALKDLDRTLELSGGYGKSACQAYCQRGLLRQLQDQKELAEQDFRSAAKLGSGYAKSMLIQLNPYAALCNQMLGEVIGKLQQRALLLE